ncbi:Ig-like domain-containing protein [Brevibacillus fluminis]|uniref:Ig-like domain-containing protein n=1 Tax=Brevibacillus fluminis TaxID=511487 RepID=UPI003F8ACCB1
MKAIKLTFLAILLVALGFTQIGFAQTTEAGDDGTGQQQELGTPVTGISLSKSGLTLNVGDTGSLTATITPADAANQAVKWASTDESVASVITSEQANKLTVSVKAKAAGEAFITATTIDGAYTAISVVKVTSPAEKRLDKLTVNEKSMTLLAGESKQLKLTAEYKDRSKEDVTAKAEWVAIPKAVAEVNNGQVTAKGQGQAWIIASYGGEFVKLEVKVVAERELKKLVAKQDRVKLAIGETKAVQLTATYTDGTTEDVTAKADWKSSDDTRLQVKAGQLTAIAAGNPVALASYGGQTAFIRVEIKAAAEKQLSKIEIRDESGKRKTKVELIPGQTATIKVVAIYNDKTETDITQDATYTNSKKTIADFANGTITAKEKGVTTITATYSGKRVQVTVQVKK